jgi:hypothetical protein
MMFNVPQYIDVEDKVAGPFTAKQLMWMFGMGAVLLVLWNILEQGAFIMAAIPVAVVFVALTFYRPYGQPLIKFISFGVLFFFRPKLYSWKRMTRTRAQMSSRERLSNIPEKKEKQAPEEKDIISLARMLDTEGRERNEQIMEIIKKNQKSK